MRYVSAACAIVFLVLTAISASAQLRGMDRGYRDPDDWFYRAPSPMVRDMRERHTRQPYGTRGPYMLEGNQTAQNGTDSNATTPYSETGTSSEQTTNATMMDGPAPAPPRSGMGQGRDGMQGQGMMRNGGGMGGMNRDMHTIHELFASHRLVDRSVQDIENGVSATTTSSDPYVTDLIRTHVRAMKRRLEQGQPIRMWDPLFRELFLHAGAIDLQIQDIDGGVRITETSDDPEVVALLRQHAREAVSEFVRQGPGRMREPTPLPHGYEPTPGSGYPNMPSEGMGPRGHGDMMRDAPQ